MDVLIGIGDFARMTYLSVKVLRHYHEIGLLEPAAVDPVTGYRRYAASQVQIAQVIRRFRDLDMPLEELSQVVHAPDLATRNTVVARHLRRMETELAKTRSTVESLRRLLEGPSVPMPVVFRSTPAMTALAIRTRLDETGGPDWVRDAHLELRAVLATTELRRGGPDGALYAPELFEHGHGDVIAYLPAEGLAGTLPTGVERIDVPAAELAVAEHRGSFEDLDQAFAALGAVVAERAIGVDGPIREHYLVGVLDTDDEDQYRTEVGWPIFRTTEQSTL